MHNHGHYNNNHNNNNYLNHNHHNHHHHHHNTGQRYSNNNKNGKKKTKKRASFAPEHITLPGKFSPDKKHQSQPAPAKAVHWGDEEQCNEQDQGGGYAMDVIDKMGNTATHFNHNDDNSSTHSNSIKSTHSHTLRPSAQQQLLANNNHYGQNGQGNFYNITKRKSMGANIQKKTNKKKNKIKRRMSRSRTFVSTTKGIKNVGDNKDDFDEEKSHQPIDSTTPKQSPLTVPPRLNNITNSAPHTAIQPPSDNMPHQITLDDFELDHQLDQIHGYNNNNNNNNNHHHHHQQYYSTHININQRNSMIPTASPTMNNYQSETTAKDFHYNTRNRNKKFNQIGSKRKSKSLKRVNIGNHNVMNHNISNNKNDANYINVPQKSKGRIKSKSFGDSSSHRNLGSLTHKEFDSFLGSENLFNYTGYDPKIVQ